MCWVLITMVLVAPACSGSSSRPTESSARGSGASGTGDDELIVAAAAGDLAAVRARLAAGASVRAVDGERRTALVRAAYGAHLEVASVLIDAGADVNAQDISRQSAYLIATSEIGERAGLALLQLTLARGGDVASLDSYNGTGLIRAADRGFLSIVELLLETSIDKNHVNRLGWTALLEAIILGRGDAAHVAVVRALVARGADVNLADASGVTPLAHARSRGHAEMVVILETAGAR